MCITARVLCLAFLVDGLVFSLSASHAVADTHATAKAILDAAGVAGGLIVHVGCGDGQLTAALCASDAYLVQGLDADSGNVDKARAHVRSLNLYGKVSIARFDGRHLPYIDNLVNLVVAENVGEEPTTEIMRVLAPNGVAYLAHHGTWTRTVKPRPKQIDEWTHYLHDASNNAVAHDEAVATPRHIQWVGSPKWARHHNHLSSTSAVVTSGGRLFAIVDEAPAASLRLPPQWSLVARDAFNGVVLWKRPVGPWEGHLRTFRSGPTELPRRLVAIDDRVYVTLGFGQPVVEIDATTGQTVRSFEETAGAVEIVHQGGLLYVVVGNIPADQYAQALRRGEASPAPRAKRIFAIAADKGESVWTKSDSDTDEMLPTTLCIERGRLFFQSPNHVICLNAQSGDELWRAPRPVRRDRRGWSTPTLVAYGDVVLSADCAAPAESKKNAAKSTPVTWKPSSGPKRGNDSLGELIALDAATGKELWRCETAQGYNSPVDLFVAGGLVWASTAPGRNTVDFTLGRDLLTGEIKRRLDTAAAFTETHHHRCYRNKATDRYILLGRTGVELIDLSGDKQLRHCWIRGACQYGVMPANGLLYVPPHACACYIQSKLSGFWALAAARQRSEVRGQESGVKNQKSERLEKGPAYKSIANRRSAIANPTEWPTYRHDPARSGRTDCVVPVGLSPSWAADVGRRITSPVIAAGKVVVASIDAHTVHALDADSGTPLWRFTAGGRIDSPPTIHNGLALFGAADGYVYCLRLDDGILVWRFRAAPEDRRTVAFDQVESVWPVTGSVLVLDGAVYCTAGRSSYLDGGMSMFRLDPATGKEIGQTRFYDRDPNTGEEPEDRIEDVELPGALPDVLSTDGRYIYLRDKRMNCDGSEQPPTIPHLYSSAGLLDDNWWHRTYWLWGERAWGRASGWRIASLYRPSGRLLVVDETTVYGFGRKIVAYGGIGLDGYHLFHADKQVQTIGKQIKNNNLALMKYQKPAKVMYHWSRDVPLVVRAMVLAGDVLFASGPEMPAAEGVGDPTFDETSPAVMMAFAADDGRDLWRSDLGAQPVFDGLAAANGRLYLSTTDGKVLCLSR